MSLGAIAAAVGLMGCVLSTIIKFKNRSQLRAGLWCVWGFEVIVHVLAYAFSTQESEGALLFGIEMACTLTIAAVALLYGKRDWQRSDTIALCSALSVGSLWGVLLLLGHEQLAFVSVFSPSLIGTWKFVVDLVRCPQVENFTVWALFLVASFLVLIGVEQFTFAELSYPVHDVSMCGAVCWMGIRLALRQAGQANQKAPIGDCTPWTSDPKLAVIPRLKAEMTAWTMSMLKRRRLLHQRHHERAYSSRLKAATDWIGPYPIRC